MRIMNGTAGAVEEAYQYSVLPIMNFSRANFERVEGLFAQTAREKLYIRNVSCFGCPVPCGKLSLIPDGPLKGAVLAGPHYETSGLLRSNCGLSDIAGIASANYLCNQLGLDTINGKCHRVCHGVLSKGNLIGQGHPRARA
jgi:aldehyde:ferredoxin oxidoreductase